MDFKIRALCSGSDVRRWVRALETAPANIGRTGHTTRDENGSDTDGYH
jgi:hypothetical protein